MLPSILIIYPQFKGLLQERSYVADLSCLPSVKTVTQTKGNRKTKNFLLQLSFAYYPTVYRKDKTMSGIENPTFKAMLKQTNELQDKLVGARRATQDFSDILDKIEHDYVVLQDECPTK